MLRVTHVERCLSGRVLRLTSLLVIIGLEAWRPPHVEEGAMTVACDPRPGVGMYKERLWWDICNSSAGRLERVDFPHDRNYASATVGRCGRCTGWSKSVDVAHGGSKARQSLFRLDWRHPPTFLSRPGVP